MSNREMICQDKKRKLHTKRSSGTCGTVTKYLILMSSGSQRARSKRTGLKKCSKTFFRKVQKQFNGGKFAISTNSPRAIGHS